MKFEFQLISSSEIKLIKQISNTIVLLGIQHALEQKFYYMHIVLKPFMAPY